MTRAERNKQNAQHSTGATSPEGKARSSQNALKTGLYSASALLPTEDPHEYRAHCESYVLDHQPQGATESDLVQSISDDVWCLRRIRKLVAAQHARLARIEESRDGKAYRIENHLAHIRMAETLGRHEQRTKNAVEKGLKLLKFLQKQTPRQVPVTTRSGFVPNTRSAAAASAAPSVDLTPETALKTAAPPDLNPAVASGAPEKVAA